tara:strand:+ start:379 stop:738 length:360 start_codon:yes stop_codon:yes gene_type:complete
MKKIITITIVLLLTQTVKSQTVNGFQLDSIPAKYVTIVSTSKIFKIFQTTTYLDYGQISTVRDIRKGQIMENGKLMVFNGTMGALNFLQSKGYKYINQYLITASGQNVYYILLENTNYK